MYRFTLWSDYLLRAVGVCDKLVPLVIQSIQQTVETIARWISGIQPLLNVCMEISLCVLWLCTPE